MRNLLALRNFVRLVANTKYFQIEFDFSRSTSALAWLNERERPKRTILFARDVCEQTMAKEGLSDFI